MAVDVIAVNGHVRAADPATGQPVRPCLVTLMVTREAFEQVALDAPSLDPLRCLAHLKALISSDPCGMRPVTPIIDIELERHRPAHPDPELSTTALTTTDLSTMDPYDFERLVRDLLLAMGFTAWRTPDSRDGGVDAVAIRDDIAIGGVCVIQAKRYTHTVPVEAVRALYGTMQEHKAYTGLVVTTSSFGPASYAFAQEVTLYQKERATGQHGNGEGGWTVSPHWRRGHWRWQPTQSGGGTQLWPASTRYATSPAERLHSWRSL